MITKNYKAEPFTPQQPEKPVAAIFTSMMEQLVGNTEALVACSQKLDKLCRPDDIVNRTTSSDSSEPDWPEMFQTLRLMYNMIASNTEKVRRTIENSQV